MLKIFNGTQVAAFLGPKMFLTAILWTKKDQVARVTQMNLQFRRRPAETPLRPPGVGIVSRLSKWEEGEWLKSGEQGG